MHLSNITQPVGVPIRKRNLQDLWASDQVLLETWIPSGLIRVNQGSESQGPFAGPDNQANNVSYLFKRGK